MREAMRNHRRGIVSLIAACALLLQGFLAHGIAVEAAVQGFEFGAFTICTAHASASAPGDKDVPASTDDTCPLCMRSVPAATLPVADFAPVVQSFGHSVQIASSPSAPAQYWTRPHSRGPPVIA
jgi:hypothetical protein